MIHFILRESMI